MKQVKVKRSLMLPGKTIYMFPLYAIGKLLKPFGQCRMCVVEVDGNLGPVTACNTTVWEGMNVVTESDNIAELRRNNLRLILANHPNDCMTCEKTG